MPVHKCYDQLNWDDFRFFSALADTGRISAAAKRLTVNHVTVSRRIDRLEESLNKTLFARSVDGYQLTHEGKALHSQLSTVTSTLERIVAADSGNDRIKRTVKLSMVHSIADALVLPQFAELQKKHPNLNLNIDTSTRNVSVVKRESDIALRLALPESGDFITRRLANLDYVLCGTEELAKKCSAGQPVPTISYGQALDQLPESKYMLAQFGASSIALQTNSATVQRSAAINGMGIALLPMFLYANSNLVSIDMSEPITREIWLLAKKSIAQVPEVRLVIESLVALFQQSSEFLVNS